MSSQRPVTQTTARPPIRNTSGEGSASSELEPTENLNSVIAASEIVTGTRAYTTGFSELLEKIHQLQASSERDLDQITKSISNQEESLNAEIANLKHRLETIEALIPVRREEVLKQVLAEAKIIIKEDLKELGGEFNKEKYDKNDQEDQVLPINSPSYGEGKYPKEDENNQQRSKCSTPSGKTKRTNSKFKMLRDSKR
jgi:DNA-binding transcriptional MerR regulator